jgi:peroxiredoxin
MLQTGTKAPDFSVPGTDPDGGEPTTYTLSAILEAGPALLNFYLFDFHPACTANVCSLHDLSWFDLDADLSVLGISTDGVFSHGVFAEDEQLDFPLLSDSDGTVAESFDVLYDEVQGHNRVAKRAIFLVDRDRTVRYAWVAERATLQPEWEDVKAAVESLSTHDTV